MHYEKFAPEDLLGPLDEVEAKHAPKDVWVKGHISLLRKGARVSVVGSRKASETGLRRAAKLSYLLATNGIHVVSGLAEGIDATAHTSAVKAGGRTIAVLGTPLDKAFPAKHRALQDAIMQDHLAISQFAPGSPVIKQGFPMRNRTMALFSDATVIVEAGEKSGTVHQGWEALRLGRQLFVLESLAKLGFKWVQELQDYGAQVLSEKNADSFLESLPRESRFERLALLPF